MPARSVPVGPFPRHALEGVPAKQGAAPPHRPPPPARPAASAPEASSSFPLGRRRCGSAAPLGRWAAYRKITLHEPIAAVTTIDRVRVLEGGRAPTSATAIMARQFPAGVYRGLGGAPPPPRVLLLDGSAQRVHPIWDNVRMTPPEAQTIRGHCPNCDSGRNAYVRCEHVVHSTGLLAEPERHGRCSILPPLLCYGCSPGRPSPRRRKERGRFSFGDDNPRLPRRPGDMYPLAAVHSSLAQPSLKQHKAGSE